MIPFWKRNRSAELDSSSMRNLNVVSKDLETNEEELKRIFKECSDIVFRPLHLPDDERLLLIFTDGMANSTELEQVILKPMIYDRNSDRYNPPSVSISQAIEQKMIAIAQIKTVDNMEQVIEEILRGNVAIFANNTSHAVIAEISDYPKRSIQEPVIEASIRGPREGFTEDLRTNTTMLRRKINSPLLKIESVTLGKITHTRTAIIYMDGMVNPSVLEEVKKRIHKIKSVSILDSSYIEEHIEDAPYSPFPQIQNTERPDTVAASVLEGKVAILIDGSPNVLIAPMTLWSGFQAAEDHYERFMYVSAVRIIRFILLIMSLLLPSTYVALTTFHPQMIPVDLMMSIAAAREGIPFPTVIETLLTEIMFEGLREAGLRLPRAVGSAVSIVGALVIGEAAVQAGFISAPIVIIVASTGIASFAFPRYSLSLPFRLLRFPLLALSGTLGFYGIATGTIAILAHLCMLRSFGMSYLEPIAPFKKRRMGDTVYRESKENESGETAVNE